ncbi:TPA: hypothetical protein QCR51_004911 [Bacillus cereus]|nr:hypothetical protein [Bacillus cereus]
MVNGQGNFQNAEDPLAFAKGCKYALALAIPFWQVIGVICYRVVKLVL